MKLVILLAVLLVALGILLLVRKLSTDADRRKDRWLKSAAKWVFHHYDNGPERVVTASQMTATGEVLQEVVVDRIPEDIGQAALAARFDIASLEAEDLAMQLNRGGNLEQIREELRNRKKI